MRAKKVDKRMLPVESFVLDSTLHDIPVTVCSCGVLLLRVAAWTHIDGCKVAKKVARKQ